MKINNQNRISNRFIQVTEMYVYMAGRFENNVIGKEKWHDQQVHGFWENIKANVDFYIQHWP